MKIICIGRNFAAHAKEMNSEKPSEPVFFLKPDTALLRDNDPFYIPNFSNDVHYECEVVIRIDKVGKNIQEKFAPKYYTSFTLGIDFTARDLQQQCKEKGLPWERAKAFDHSAPISNVFLSTADFDMNNLSFRLEKNGTTVQEGNTNDWIFNIDQIIAYVSQYMTLKTGDLIYMGTPEGVGPVKIGDKLKGFVEDKEMFHFEVK